MIKNYEQMTGALKALLIVLGVFNLVLGIVFGMWWPAIGLVLGIGLGWWIATRVMR